MTEYVPPLSEIIDIEILDILCQSNPSGGSGNEPIGVVDLGDGGFV